MRLLHLTAGAGGMYCGTCLRDNTLAAELLIVAHTSNVSERVSGWRC